MRKNTKGQALIEFILILPILLILTIGIFDLFNIQNKKLHFIDFFSIIDVNLGQDNYFLKAF